MPYQSEYPALSVSALKHQGVFSNGGRPVGLMLNGAAFLIRHNEDDDSVTIAWKAEEPKVQKVQLQWVRVGYGRRPYLICPLSGRRRLTLYFHIAFASAEALGLTRESRTGGRVVRSRAVANKAKARLLGSDGLPPARGRARKIAARKLKESGLRSQLAAAALLEVERIEQAHLRRRYRHHGAIGVYSTAAALQAGARAHPSLTSHAIVAHLAGRIGEPPTELGCSGSHRVGLIPDYPALDVRVLEKIWQMDEQGRWGVALVWPDGSQAPLTVYLMASFDVLDRPALFLEMEVNGKVLKQTIELEPSRPRTPKRWFMRCPVTQARTELLYFRGGCFASAKAQRLVHPSQRTMRFSSKTV